MSGHSKWATIHRQKELQDAKRGLLFSKFARAITLAAKEAGADPNTNLRLRLAIESAHQANMPKENIDRAIKRAVGGGEGALEEVKYEGYGPAGVAVIVEAATDNKNRTSQEIKNLFERVGGALAGPGSVSFQFDSSGLLLVQKVDNSEEQMLKLIDLGVEDIEETEDGIEVYVKPAEVGELKKRLEGAGFKILRADLVARPKNLVTISEPKKAKGVLAFLEALHSHEDVQNVFANLDVPNEVLKKL